MQFNNSELNPSRNWGEQVDEEEAGVDYTPIIQFSPNFEPNIKTKSVIIGTNGIGVLFCEALVKSLKERQLIGTVLMPNYELNKVKYVPKFFNDNIPENSCLLYTDKGQQDNFVIIVNKIKLEADDFNVVANTLLKRIECQEVLIFDDLEMHKYYHGSVKNKLYPPILRKIETDARREQKKDTNIEYLESPNVSIGLSASFLSYCQKRDIQASIFVSIVESVWDENSLIAFETAVKSVFDEKFLSNIRQFYHSLLKNNQKKIHTNSLFV